VHDELRASIRMRVKEHMKKARKGRMHDADESADEELAEVLKKLKRK